MPIKDSLLGHIINANWQTTQCNNGWQLKRGNNNAIYLSFTQHWTCLQQPLTGISSPTEEGQLWVDRASLYRYLLRQNERLFMARLALDANSKPILMAEVPAKEAHRHLFDQALTSVTHYGSECQEEIDNIFLPSPLTITSGVSQTAEVLVDITSTNTKRKTDTPGIPKQTIARYVKAIETKGWGVQKEPTGQTWYLGYKGRVRFFDVYLTTTPAWVYFQIPLLVGESASVLRADERYQALFMDYLLGLNDLLFMVKLGLSHEGQVLMLLEIPTETLDFALFRLAIDAIATALDRYAQEIFMMAALEHDSVLATQLTEAMAI